MKTTTLRLPEASTGALAEHCEWYGATRNRVAVLALRTWLGGPQNPL
jgi:hypothetical protein